MRIERLRRWQWIIVGAFLGVLVATVKLWAGVKEPPDTLTVAPHVFENQIVTGTDPSRKPAYQVGLIVLHPPEEVVVPGSKLLEKREFITYYVWFPEKPSEKGAVTTARPKPHRVILDQDSMTRSPYLGDVSKLTGREYLAKLKNHVQKMDRKVYKYAQNFEFRYAWLETPKAAYTTYGLAGVVIVGVIWPSILRLLVGAGYGRPVDDDEAYLARFKGYKEQAAAPKKSGATEEEMAELLRLEAALEAKLKDSGLEMTQPVGLAAGASADTNAQVAEKAARKFSGTAAEEAKQVATKGDHHKEFGADQGDYYPTEVHGKHKR